MSVVYGLSVAVTTAIVPRDIDRCPRTGFCEISAEMTRTMVEDRNKEGLTPLIDIRYAAGGSALRVDEKGIAVSSGPSRRPCIFKASDLCKKT